MMHGFGDRPAREDLLDRVHLRNELAQVLRLSVLSGPRPSATPDDATEAGIEPAARDTSTTGPRVITLQGAWGTGKTSLMRMVFDELRAQPGATTSLNGAEPDGDATEVLRRPRSWSWPRLRTRLRAPSFTPWQAYQLAKQPARSRRAGVRPLRPGPQVVVPVWFNPWAHKSPAEVWAGLTQTIIRGARPLLGATDARWHRYWFTRNLDRLDAAVIRRTLRQRIFQPMIPALLLPVLPVIGDLLLRGSVDRGGVIACFCLLAAIVARGAFIALRGHASGYLPADMLEGPVGSGPFATNITPESPLHDPLYQARAGFLYLVQHDVNDVVRDMSAAGGHLVVFVDDLDRCPAATVAEVFEAINIFIAEDFSTARFVIGLDPSVVTRRLAESLLSTEKGLWQYPDDPTSSWSYLRKLSQLPVTLPTTREAHTARLMRRHTPVATPPSSAQRARVHPVPLDAGPVAAVPLAAVPLDAVPVAAASTTLAGAGEVAEHVAGPASIPGSVGGSTVPNPDTRGVSQSATVETVSARPAPTVPRQFQPSGEPPRTTLAIDQTTHVNGNGSETLLFEGDPAVRDHLRVLAKLRPHQSVRETKRMLTLWGFYVRLLNHLLPEDDTGSADFGRDVLTLAEILTRWPALIPALGPHSLSGSGLRDLIEVARSRDKVWNKALAKIGLGDEIYRQSTANLKVLLGLHANHDVAFYAECVL